MGALATEHVTDVGVEDLRDLMRTVNETAQRLQGTHAALREEVARLQDELAEANAQLRRSRSLAALGEMAAGIAHEVRNPLGSIQLYVQMLAEDIADRPGPVELCGKIARAVEGLDAIVRDVLLFSRDMSLRPTEVPAAELIDRALTGCESLLVGGRIEVVRDVEPECRLCVDVALMTQALVNVVRNALEAMIEFDGPTRRLRVGARAGRRRRTLQGPPEPGIVFTVEDTGGGIQPEVLGRMFNPFFTTRKTGTGLGLAIVHRIVDTHGGQISVRNSPAGGARVQMWLPPLPASPTAPGAAPGAGIAGALFHADSSQIESNRNTDHEQNSRRR